MAKQAPSALSAAAEPRTPAQQAPSKPKANGGVPARQAPPATHAPWGPPAGLTNAEQNAMNTNALLKEAMNVGTQPSNRRKSRKSRLQKRRKSRRNTKKN